jgi:hypothetical protein
MNKEEYEALLALTRNQFTSNATAKRGATVSDEMREKYSKSRKGRKHSEETKKKIGAGNKGKVLSAETRAKLSASRQNVVISAETRAKISASGKGRKHSAETRLKQSLNNGFAKKVQTPIGIFISLAAAAKAYGKCSTTVRTWIRKKYDGFNYID